MGQHCINTRSMIFTIYGDYIRHYGNEIWIGSLIRLLAEFGHNEQAVRAAVSRMGKQDWIQSHKKGNKSYYFLTEKGIQRMGEAADRIFKLQTHKWDGKWRMLMYNIPEEKRQIRDDLRQELIWSGFGTLSNSCWISPNHLENQVKSLIKKYELDDYVHFFISEYKGPSEDNYFVQQYWNLTEINEKYNEFIQYYSPKFIIDRNNIKNGEKTNAECFIERTKLIHEYRKFLFIDPGLPDELLPEHWLGSHASALFKEYYLELAEPAGDFFEDVFKEGNEISRKNKKYNMYTHPLIAE